MKYQISAMDVHFLVKELNEKLSNSKADKVFQPDDREFLFLFHVSGSGKRFLRIKLPNYMYLTDFKGEMPETPTGFCMVLRKYLSGTRLKGIKQYEFERIVEFEFEAKEKTFRLIIELFSKGNMALTSEDYTIISLVEAKKWKGRTLRGNVIYEFPKGRNNLFKMGLEEFSHFIVNSDKESIVKTLALDLTIGGSYSEEVCKRAGIDKDKKGLTDNEIKIIFTELKKLIDLKPSPEVVYEGSYEEETNLEKEQKPLMITPVSFESMKGHYIKKYETINEALDTVITQSAIDDGQKKAEEPYKKEIDRIKKQIAQQTEQIAELEASAVEDQKKGEIIYNNYKLASEILAELKKAREKYSFDEMKEKLKGHKVVKEINSKDKTVVVEI